MTSQLILDGVRKDLQVQGGKQQSQTRHPRSGRIPTQSLRTGHPSSDQTVTASGQTYEFTPDMRAQPGQPWTRHQTSGQAASGQTFKRRPNTFRPEVQAQTGPALTASVWKGSMRTSQPQAGLPHNRHPSSDQTASNLPSQMGRTRHHGPNNLQTCHHRPDPIRRNIQAQAGQVQPHTRHPK